MVDGIKNKEYLLSLTLRQLRQEASKLSVPLYSRKTKAVLIDLIDKYQQNASETYSKTSPKNTSPKISELSSKSVKDEVITKPDITKKISTPKKPLGRKLESK